MNPRLRSILIGIGLLTLAIVAIVLIPRGLSLYYQSRGGQHIDYVLRKPAPEQRDAILACIGRTLDASADLMAGDMDRATLKIHAGPQRPKPPRPQDTPGDPA